MAVGGIGVGGIGVGGTAVGGIGVGSTTACWSASSTVCTLGSPSSDAFVSCPVSFSEPMTSATGIGVAGALVGTIGGCVGGTGVAVANANVGVSGTIEISVAPASDGVTSSTVGLAVLFVLT